MDFISLLVGIILVIVAALFRVGALNIIVKRYVWFQRAIRRRDIVFDEKAVSKFYSNLCFIIACILFIGIILQLTTSNNSALISWWIWIVCIVIGVSTILYMNLNLNKNFIKEESDINN
ncbi:MAG: hypothetical protein ACTSVV_14580 [Promethearchaeota archaeon]